MKNKRQKNVHVQKKALNVVSKVAGGYQVYQLYANMRIPLLGSRMRGQFVERPAKTADEAFDRLYSEYYE
jgi:hypothetical protein